MESVKLLFIEWILEVLRSISLYFLKQKARMEIDDYAVENDTLDMRTAPPAVKKGIIHDEAVLKQRWDLCSSCEFLTEGRKCTQCGCYMAVKHKMAMARCPVGKWERHIEDKNLSGITVTS